jgi:hypothetical protein
MIFQNHTFCSKSEGGILTQLDSESPLHASVSTTFVPTGPTTPASTSPRNIPSPSCNAANAIPASNATELELDDEAV